MPDLSDPLARDKDESATRGSDVPGALVPELPIMDCQDNVVGIGDGGDACPKSQWNTAGSISLQHNHEAHKTLSRGSSSEQKAQSQNTLPLDQKQYLIRKLMATQNRKFAKSFWVASHSNPLDSAQVSGSLNLRTILMKLLDDEYISAGAFQDDVKRITHQSGAGSDMEGTDERNGKLLLDHVTNFMKKLPKSRKPKSTLSVAQMGDERKTVHKEDKQVAAEKPKLPCPGEAKQREIKYADKQEMACNDGRSPNEPNEHENCHSLVIEKIGDLTKETETGKDITLQTARMVSPTDKGPSYDGSTSMRAASGENINSGDLDRESETTSKGKIASDRTEALKRKSPSSSQEVQGRSKQRKDSDPVGETAAMKKKRLDVEHTKQREEERARFAQPSKVKQPEDIIWTAITTHAASNNAVICKGLRELHQKGLPTEKHLAALEESRTRGFNILFRTASRTAGHAFNMDKPASNGHTTNNVMMPAADCNREQSTHKSIADMPAGAIIYMVGTHLAWLNMRCDEFLSTSISFVFVLIHALDRHNEGQGGVTIQALERDKARNAEGNSAAFHSAADLCESTLR